MRVFVLVLFLFVPMVAHGATCSAGQYLENSECIICPKTYYCPGDDAMHSCPETTQGGYVSTWVTWPGSAVGATKLVECLNYSQLHTFDHGTGTIRCFYNSNTELYDTGCHYANTKKCDAGYYSALVDSKNNNYDCLPVEYGFYSPADDLKRYQCADGYSTRIETATDISECVPLCTAGATMFHVGDYVFNIYKEKYTTPAINIGLGDGSVCYVPLVEGSGKGALNVDYKGVIYHTSY